MNIRPMRDTDLNLVLSTWLRSYYDALKFYSSGTIRVPYPKDDIFFQGHQDRIKHLLKTAQCLVCVAPDEDNQIIGYVVFDEDTIHFCYVKHVFRKMGVGKKLMAETGKPHFFSHYTKFAKYLNHGLIYNPYTF